MRPKKPPRDQCPDGDRQDCPLHCRFNHFEADDLQIWAWELRCLECSYRETIGFRSDEEEHWEGINPKQCPFCEACDLAAGRNPCGE
jgi:hypothetical protein